MKVKYFFAKPIFRDLLLKIASRLGSSAYWTGHMVSHDRWPNAQNSLEHLLWRNDQYPGYIDLMPVAGADGLVVLDYGCGPGHDLVGFSEFSKPARLIGVDVSSTALAASGRRLALHGQDVELIKIDESINQIPIESNSVDLVHSSGVFHHVKHLNAALMEMRRILKPGGRAQVMVYNYDSLWLHLYTAYIVQIEQRKYSDASVLDAFRHTTDGPDCPISNCYQPARFIELVENFGFIGRFKGASISVHKLEILSKRFDAIRSRRLAREHRDFLSAIKFNEDGHPLVGGVVAGINGCYEFRKI